MLRHSIEVAFLAGMLAEEIGLNGTLARRCGLLHDIGKAADHEAEGGHPKIGADLLKRYGERPEVIHAAVGPPRRPARSTTPTRCSSPPPTPAAPRGPAPAARRSNATSSAWRNSESIAASFPGVEQAFAIQAGRELRVIVSAKETTDEIGRQDLPRHRQGLRGAADLSRRDQGDRAPRDAARRDGAVREDEGRR